MNDWQLIEEFARGRSEGAFQKLVERHAGMVLASARRQVGDEQLAQDIAQAVFILLARKAGSLRRGTVLAGWLFQTTRFVAARAMRSEQRRQRREQEAFDMQQLTSNDEAWRRMAPVIDEALDQLNRGDRDAILLRFIEGRSVREVSVLLGVTEEAAKKRVARALERLREALVRNDVALPVASLVAGFSTQTNASVPLLLLASLTANSTAVTGASTSATGLVANVLSAWRWAKLRWLAGLGALTALTLTAIFLSQRSDPRILSTQTVEEIARPALAQPVSNRSETSAEATAIAAAQSPFKVLRFRVVAANSGGGIPGARLSVNTVQPGWGKWERRHDLTTDVNGRCDVSYPAETKRLDVGVMKNGFATRSAVWPAEGHRGIADEYTLRVERVTNWMGGFLRTSDGKPVRDAEIEFNGRGSGGHSQREPSREYFGILYPPVATRSDAQGRWWLQIVPPRNSGFQISARHPRFAETSIISTDRQESLADVERDEVKQLWAGELVTTMKAAYTLTGTVVDEQNRPVAGARIQQRTQGEEFETDADGVFRVPRLPAGEWQFTVSADGFAPVRTNAVLAEGIAPVVVTLKPGAVLRVRVVNENGDGVAGATVGLEQWGPHRTTLEWRVTTDREGRIEWQSAPRDVELLLFATADGYCMTRDIKLKADGEEHTIRLRQVLTIYGRVVDADAGFGIADFRAIPAYGFSYHDQGNRWFAGETVRGTNGLFSLTFVENQPPYQVKVVAEGYEDWVSLPTNYSGTLLLDIALKRYALEDSVRGVVLKPSGEPAADAQVALLSFEHNVRLTLKFLFEGGARWLAQADSAGAFRFPANRLAHSVAAVSRDGYVLLRLPKKREPVTLQLQPWGRVEVTVDESARTHPVQTIELYDPASDNYQGRVSLLGSYSEKADANGRFVFKHVPPGELSVFINSGVGITYHHGTPVVVIPGETARVTIRERPGTLVKGRLTPVPQLTVSSDHVVLHFNPDPIVPAPFQDLPPEERRQKEFEFWSSPAGREWSKSTRQTHVARMYPDGTFVSLGRLPPGKYRLNAIFKNTSSSQKIEIGDDPEAVLDVGEVRLR